MMNLKLGVERKGCPSDVKKKITASTLRRSSSADFSKNVYRRSYSPGNTISQHTMYQIPEEFEPSNVSEMSSDMAEIITLARCVNKTSFRDTTENLMSTILRHIKKECNSEACEKKKHVDLRILNPLTYIPIIFPNLCGIILQIAKDLRVVICRDFTDVARHEYMQRFLLPYIEYILTFIIIAHNEVDPDLLVTYSNELVSLIQIYWPECSNAAVDDIAFQNIKQLYRIIITTIPESNPRESRGLAVKINILESIPSHYKLSTSILRSHLGWTILSLMSDVLFFYIIPTEDLILKCLTILNSLLNSLGQIEGSIAAILALLMSSSKNYSYTKAAAILELIDAIGNNLVTRLKGKKKNSISAILLVGVRGSNENTGNLRISNKNYANIVKSSLVEVQEKGSELPHDKSQTVFNSKSCPPCSITLRCISRMFKDYHNSFNSFEVITAPHPGHGVMRHLYIIFCLALLAGCEYKNLELLDHTFKSICRCDLCEERCLEYAIALILNEIAIIIRKHMSSYEDLATFLSIVARNSRQLFTKVNSRDRAKFLEVLDVTLAHVYTTINTDLNAKKIHLMVLKCMGDVYYHGETIRPIKIAHVLARLVTELKNSRNPHSLVKLSSFHSRVISIIFDFIIDSHKVMIAHYINIILPHISFILTGTELSEICVEKCIEVLIQVANKSNSLIIWDKSLRVYFENKHLKLSSRILDKLLGFYAVCLKLARSNSSNSKSVINSSDCVSIFKTLVQTASLKNPKYINFIHRLIGMSNIHLISSLVPDYIMKGVIENFNVESAVVHKTIITKLISSECHVYNVDLESQTSNNSIYSHINHIVAEGSKLLTILGIPPHLKTIGKLKGQTRTSNNRVIDDKILVTHSTNSNNTMEYIAAMQRMVAIYCDVCDGFRENKSEYKFGFNPYHSQEVPSSLPSKVDLHKCLYYFVELEYFFTVKNLWDEVFILIMMHNRHLVHNSNSYDIDIQKGLKELKAFCINLLNEKYEPIKANYKLFMSKNMLDNEICHFVNTLKLYISLLVSCTEILDSENTAKHLNNIVNLIVNMLQSCSDYRDKSFRYGSTIILSSVLLMGNSHMSEDLIIKILQALSRVSDVIIENAGFCNVEGTYTSVRNLNTLGMALGFTLNNIIKKSRSLDLVEKIANLISEIASVLYLFSYDLDIDRKLHRSGALIGMILVVSGAKPGSPEIKKALESSIRAIMLCQSSEIESIVHSNMEPVSEYDKVKIIPLKVLFAFLSSNGWLPDDYRYNPRFMFKLQNSLFETPYDEIRMNKEIGVVLEYFKHRNASPNSRNNLIHSIFNSYEVTNWLVKAIVISMDPDAILEGLKNLDSLSVTDYKKLRIENDSCVMVDDDGQNKLWRSYVCFRINQLYRICNVRDFINSILENTNKLPSPLGRHYVKNYTANSCDRLPVLCNVLNKILICSYEYHSNPTKYSRELYILASSLEGFNLRNGSDLIHSVVTILIETVENNVSSQPASLIMRCVINLAFKCAFMDESESLSIFERCLTIFIDYCNNSIFRNTNCLDYCNYPEPIRALTNAQYLEKMKSEEIALREDNSTFIMNLIVSDNGIPRFFDILAQKLKFLVGHRNHKTTIHEKVTDECLLKHYDVTLDSKYESVFNVLNIMYTHILRYGSEEHLVSGADMVYSCSKVVRIPHSQKNWKCPEQRVLSKKVYGLISSILNYLWSAVGDRVKKREMFNLSAVKVASTILSVMKFNHKLVINIFEDAFTALMNRSTEIDIMCIIGLVYPFITKWNRCPNLHTEKINTLIQKCKLKECEDIFSIVIYNIVEASYQRAYELIYDVGNLENRAVLILKLISVISYTLTRGAGREFARNLWLNFIPSLLSSQPLYCAVNSSALPHSIQTLEYYNMIINIPYHLRYEFNKETGCAINRILKSFTDNGSQYGDCFLTEEKTLDMRSVFLRTCLISCLNCPFVNKYYLCTAPLKGFQHGINECDQEGIY